MAFIAVVSHAFAFSFYLLVTLFLLSKVEGRSFLYAFPRIHPISGSVNFSVPLNRSNLSFSATHTQTWLLILSCAVTSLWGLASIFFSYGYFSYGFISIFEIYSDGLWCACLISLLQGASLSKHKQWFFDNYAIGFIAILCASLSLLILYGPIWFEDEFSTPFFNLEIDKISLMGQLFLSVISLALVEQVFRNTRQERRWGIKFLCIGLSLLFMYDFYLYANSLLFQVIDIELWQARGFVCALTAPFVALTAIRDREWARDLYPSHTVVFKSATFIICGLYLFTMGLIGYFIRLFGGDLGQILEIVFMFGATLILLVLLTSTKVRSALKLNLAKNWFKLRYDYREEWLAFTDLLSHQESEQSLGTRSIMALANMCESPSGILFENNDNHLSYKANWNRDGNFYEIQEPVDSPLCQYLQTNQVLELNNSLILTPSWLKKLSWAWLVIPLIHEQTLHGVVVLSHPRILFNVNWEVLDLLRVASRQATIGLVQAKTSEALSIAKQFESYNRLATFVVHDLKNIITQLSLISRNAAKHQHNPKFIESAFKTIDNAVKQMEKLGKQMQSKGEGEKGDSKSLSLNPILPKSSINLVSVLDSLISHRQSPYIVFENIISNTSHLELEENFYRNSSENLHSNQSPHIHGDAERCYHILSHLIENAEEAIMAKQASLNGLSAQERASFSSINSPVCHTALSPDSYPISTSIPDNLNQDQTKGLVKIILCDTVGLSILLNDINRSNLLCDLTEVSEAELNPNSLYLLIEDNGCGMTPDFVTNGLFKPFVTTKAYKGMGIGVFEAKTYLDEIGGSLKVKSKLGIGTLFLLQFLIVKDNHSATTDFTDN